MVSRLTLVDEEGKHYVKDIHQALGKLWVIENLEQELGIALPILFDLIDKSIWYISGNNILKMDIEFIDFSYIYSYVDEEGNFDNRFLIRDFNQEWFTSEEEAKTELALRIEFKEKAGE